jgi:hypothetical protein
MQIFVKLRNISGRHTGVAKLTVNLDVRSGATEVVRILSLTAEVLAAASDQTYDFSTSVNFIGHAFLESDAGQLTPGQEHNWTLALGLNPHQLQKIEEIRNGGDLYLIMRFTGIAAEFERTDASKLRGFFSIDVSTLGYSSGYCPLKIAQSDWMKILKELGYGDTFLIEMPLRSIRSRKRTDKALEYLAKAWEHYEEGNDRETLASCYSAFESLAKHSKSKHPDQNAFEALLGNLPDREIRDKAKFLMDYICRFLQLGRHVPGHEPAPLNRKDSEFALIISQAAIAYLLKNESR